MNAREYTTTGALNVPGYITAIGDQVHKMAERQQKVATPDVLHHIAQIKVSMKALATDAEVYFFINAIYIFIIIIYIFNLN